jgi:AmmeMemoRadiSam system protein B
VAGLAVRSDATAREIADLAGAIGRVMTPDAIMVVSADFAHGVAPLRARDNDAASIRALESLDLTAVRRFGDEHVDARAALAVGIRVAAALGAGRFELLARTDGSALPGYAGGPVTSYIAGYYRRP